MLTLRDHQSENLVDPWEYLGPQRCKFLEQSWARVFRDYLLQHLPVKELASGFRDDFGRPSKDLSVVLGVLVLQQLHDLTDQQTTEAVALNIAWHYSLDIRHESDAYLCERTLRNYRRKVLELGLDDVLFRTLTDRLIEEIGVDTTKQRLDSTAVKSATRGLTRLGILVEATSKFLRELKRKHADLYAVVDSEVLRKYVERKGKGCFADTRSSESKRRLSEAAQDVYALVEQFQHGEAASLESFVLLERVFHEQCEISDDSDRSVIVRPPRTKDCNTDGRVLRCPTGHAPIETSIGDVRLQVLFVTSDCTACPQKHCCPLAAVGRSSKRYQYTHDRVQQRARRLQDASEEFRDQYRWRAGVEATMSRFKHQMGMANLRIRGMAKVTYTALLRALGLHIHRVAAYRAAGE